MAQALAKTDSTNLNPILNLSLLPGIRKFVDECVKCDSFFDKENIPYFVKCGHSICSTCKDIYENKPLLCCKCAIILPNASDAFINKFLWQQLMRLNRDIGLKTKVVDLENETLRDAGLSLEKEIIFRARQFLELKLFYENLVADTKIGGYENVVEEYRKMVEEFGIEQKNGLKEALLNLSGKVGLIEDSLQNVTNWDKILEKLNNVRSTFFSVFENFQIQCNIEEVCDFLDKNYVVYAVTADESLAAQLTNEEIGLHISCFIFEQNTGRKLFFWYDDMVNQYKGPPKYIFLDLEATIAKKRFFRRIYITIVESSYSNELFELFIGLHASFQGTCLELNGNSLCADLPDPTGLITERFTKFGTVGIVSLIPGERRVRLGITMKVISEDEDEDEDVGNDAIGHVTSGFGFLTQAAKFDIVNYGVCYESQRSWY